ncbi:TPA: LuxR C-terminal-related transcriptional regulator [Serratia fonticola]
MTTSCSPLLKCMGCEFNCDLNKNGDNSANDFHCGNKKLIIWPDCNYFFKKSINDLVFKRMHCGLSGGVIIVDFSMTNIACFIQKEWLVNLEKMELKIILIASQGMSSLANFWMQRSNSIWSVIAAGGDINDLCKKIKNSLSGSHHKSRSLRSMNEREVTILQLLSEGTSNQEMARILECDTRDVYRFQYSLCKKLGSVGRLRNLHSLLSLSG